MLDINFIRKNQDAVQRAAKNKNVEVDIVELLRLDDERLRLIQEVEELRSLKNDVNDLIQKAGTPEEKAEIIEKGKEIKGKLDAAEPGLKTIEEQFTALLSLVPNVPTDDTPTGADESGNQVVRTCGEKPAFAFQPKEHWELGQALGLIDNETAAKVAGSRFTYLKGGLALLEFALIQHVFRTLTDEAILQSILEKNNLALSPKSFVPVVPPVFVKPDVLHRMARLEPKEDRYHIPSDDLYLVGSAEHTLGPIHMDETLNESDLPIRYIGFSTAFRREAGSYGKDVKGILRVHQFDKLEMESFTVSEKSVDEQNFFVAIQEHLLQSLKLPYQVVAVCTGDMGKPDMRQIDIETWLPGQNTYRETNTADLMGDYQSRRLKTKVRRTSGETEYVHMNDATAFAIGRTLIAIMENYQEENGSIRVPEVLKPYISIDRIQRKV